MQHTGKACLAQFAAGEKKPECLEYVIIHELVHLLEKNHNNVFKGHMDRFYPNWRTVKANLNDQMLDHMDE